MRKRSALMPPDKGGGVLREQVRRCLFALMRFDELLVLRRRELAYVFAAGEAFKVFPEGLVLLNQCFFAVGQLEAEHKVRQRVLVQDVVAVECIALYQLKVDAKVAYAQPVVGFAAAIEAPEILAGALQVVGSQRTEFFDNGQLNKDIQLVQLCHTLITESYLKHCG